MLKSLARKKVLLTVVLSERVFLKKVSHTFKSLLGDLYVILKIMFLVWLFSISIQYLHSLSLSHCSSYKSESQINIGMYPSNWHEEVWLISLSFLHVSVRLNLVFKDL